MIIVILYQDRFRLKPSMSSPIYVNLAQSRKLERLPPGRYEHLWISCLNSLQASPHRRKGTSSAERSRFLEVLKISASEPNTLLNALVSCTKSRTCLNENCSF